jgi:TrkA domain protein
LDVEETPLPGIGLRHDFVTELGTRLGVVSLRNGARQLLLYDRTDPDACTAVELTPDESEALAELLGAPRITERLARLREQVAGLATDAIGIHAGSRYAHATLGDTAIRTRTGASVVAVLRAGEMLVAPEPTFRFRPGDQVVVVGTPGGINAVRALLVEP